MSDMEKNLIEGMQEVRDFLVHGKKLKGAKVYISDAISTKRIRKKLGMSQAKFAKHYGFNRRTLQDWEQGRLVPSPNQQVLLKMIDEEAEFVERFLPKKEKQDDFVTA